jgi:hypothetical protein
MRDGPPERKIGVGLLGAEPRRGAASGRSSALISARRPDVSLLYMRRGVACVDAVRGSRRRA